MTPMSGTSWLLLVGLLLISPDETKGGVKIEKCISTNQTFVVGDKFFHVNTQNNLTNACAVFLKRNMTVNQTMDATWPQWDERNYLYISKHLINHDFTMYAVWGSNCPTERFQNFKDSTCEFYYNISEPCNARCIHTGRICKDATYNKSVCVVDGMYIINVTDTNKNCISCDSPVKTPGKNVPLNVTLNTSQGGKVEAADAVKVMGALADFVSSMNETSVALSAGEGVTGVLLAYKNPVDIETVSFAYASPNESINIISSSGNANVFSRSVSVSKEAFNQALRQNISKPFAAVMRFNNMEGDALNSIILNNEVLAVEMGANITNLTDKIDITFRSLTYSLIPKCHSWSGEGSQPNWTQDGCDTITSGPNITCRCSHLTFFAILMTAPNETISSTNLKNLTIITQVGCGLSMLFLSLVLFIHFFMSKAKPNKSSTILMHLVVAMLLLDLTFLINSLVANLKSSVGCIIMGAAMHYFMLATFTWFAAQAFHLCFQLHTRAKIQVHRYILKVSVTSWALPSVIVITLLIIGKYGTEDINTDTSVSMCWITDVNVHYIVNIGYYALVFLFTFTTFIIVLSWLVCLKQQKGGAQVNRSSNGSKSMVSIMGLCCMLGLTWGFAFFAYGALRIPAYYIFTVLNSFQGFFLFVYYHNIRGRTATTDASNKSSTCSTATLQTSLDVMMNPYTNLGSKT